MDCPSGSPAFLNAVVEIATTRPPAELLADLAALERDLGRPARRERNAPRPLDVDILYAGDLVFATPGLVVPHPRMTRRRFVLQPLAEIRPDLTPPGQTRTVAQLLATLPDSEAVRPVGTAW